MMAVLSRMRPLITRLLMLTLGAGVLLGLWAALQRLGWSMPTISAPLVGIHGSLMIAVMGALVSLERATALAALDRRHSWAYLAPVATALGAVTLIITGATPLALGLITLGSGGMALIFVVILRRHLALYTLTMALAAACWLVGNALWLSGQPVYALVHLWIGFLVLTIVGERLELSRVRRLTRRSQQLFAGAVLLFLIGLVTSVFTLDAGARVTGLGEVALALWLLRYDIARRTVRGTGVTRYIAACLLIGYGWLAVGGALGIAFGATYAGFNYDAFLHAILLGFVMSMVFGHAPIIIPALTGKTIPFARGFYLPLATLHVMLLVRVLSDLAAWNMGRMVGGLFNVIAVLLFLGVLLFAAVGQPFLGRVRPRNAAV